MKVTLSYPTPILQSLDTRQLTPLLFTVEKNNDNFPSKRYPYRDKGHNTKRREIISNWMGFKMLSSIKITGNNDNADSYEEDKKDDDDDH